MVKLTDFRVGQKAYVERTGNMVRFSDPVEDRIFEVTIEKVGRKYVTIAGGMQFQETYCGGYVGLVERTDYCVDYLLYPDKKIILDKFKKKELLSKIRKRLGKKEEEISVEKLQAIQKILDCENPVPEERENKVVVDIGFGKIVAEKNADPSYKEIVVYLEDNDSTIIQDLVLVGKEYHYGDDLEVVDDDNLRVLIWSDETSEDYTHNFKINKYVEEISDND